MLTAKLTPDTLDDTIPEDDAVCCVCGYSDIDGDNVMVMCDSCSVAVHKDCYAITDDDLKKDKWYCLPCSQGLYPKTPNGVVNTDRKCIACNHVGGAFSKTLDNRWIHTPCAMFNPQIKLTDLGVDVPPKSSDTPTHECEICKSNFGYTIKCSYIDCHKYMHPHCMIRTPEDYTIDSFPNPANKQKSIDCPFCKEHSALAKQRHSQISCIIYNGAAVACSDAKRAELRQARRDMKRQQKEREHQREMDDAEAHSDAVALVQTTRSGRPSRQIPSADAMLSGDDAVRALRDADTDADATDSRASEEDKPAGSRRRRRRGEKKEGEEGEGEEGPPKDGDAGKEDTAPAAGAAAHAHAPRRQPRSGADTLGEGAHAGAAAAGTAGAAGGQAAAGGGAQPQGRAASAGPLTIGQPPTYAALQNGGTPTAPHNGLLNPTFTYLYDPMHPQQYLPNGQRPDATSIQPPSFPPPPPSA